MSNAYNIKEINQEQAINLCRFYIRNDQNMLMLGRRGVGKTAICMQSALYCGYKITYINLSVLERSDLLGYPSLFDKGDVITFKSPYFLPYLKEGQKPDCVLVFDEIDKAPPEVLSPLLEILQFKTINAKPLNAAACVLTGNLINEGTYNNTISTAILDRCAKYILTFDFAHWSDWAKLNDVHDLVLGFLTSNQDLACGDIEGTLLASPSPRGWVYVSRAITQAINNKITDIDAIIDIVGGFVGQDAAVKFEVWWKYAQDHEKHISSLIESGYLNIEIHKLDITEQLVFCIMACNVVKNKIITSTAKKRSKYIDNICNFFMNNKIQPEIQMVSIGNVFNIDLVIKYELYKNKTFFKLHSEINTLIGGRK